MILATQYIFLNNTSAAPRNISTSKYPALRRYISKPLRVQQVSTVVIVIKTLHVKIHARQIEVPSHIT